MLAQQCRDCRVAFLFRNPQGGQAALVQQIDASVVQEQLLHYAHVPFYAGLHQRRHPQLVFHIDIGAACQQRGNLFACHTHTHEYTHTHTHTHTLIQTYINTQIHVS